MSPPVISRSSSNNSICAVGLFAEAVTNPKTKKTAIVIPIHGNIKDPKTIGRTTFVNILNNAFVQAFHESLSSELKTKQTNTK